jgi:23S rRNA (guanosine2251-2'-O)-methyltransferase
MSWITSRHAITAALQRDIRATLYLSDARGRDRELSRLAQSRGIPVRTVAPSWLRQNAGTSARGIALKLSDVLPNGTTGSAATRELKQWLKVTKPGSTGPVLVLDHITDPQNVGAILRSAHLFNAALVVVPARRSVLSSDAVRRSSAGASDAVPVAIVSNCAGAIREFRDAGWWTFAADMEATLLPEAPLDRASVIVLGAEGKGVSPAVVKACDMAVTIPACPPPGTTVDSFNVSVAAGIFLYEWTRRYGIFRT